MARLEVAKKPKNCLISSPSGGTIVPPVLFF